MKKTLNEEIGRIKSIMGCCKGKINEAEANCFSPESEQGMQMLNMAAQDIKEMGLTQEDFAGDNGAETPEIKEAKTKLVEMVDPVFSNASKEDRKRMIQEIKRLRKEHRQQKRAETQQGEVNEQTISAGAVWAEITGYIASIPSGVWIVVGAWLLLRLVRGYIYCIIAGLMGCGRDLQRNFLVKLFQLVFLDFKNLVRFDDNVHGNIPCGYDF